MVTWIIDLREAPRNNERCSRRDWICLSVEVVEKLSFETWDAVATPLCPVNKSILTVVDVHYRGK